MKKLYAVFALAGFIFGIHPVSATVLFSFEETGGDVVGTLSGSLDVNSLAPGVTGLIGFPREISGPVARVFDMAAGQAVDYYGAAFFGFVPFGTGFFTGGASSGSVFGIDASSDQLYLPTGYTGGSLSGTMTLPSETFAALGITPGTYVYTPHEFDSSTSEYLPVPQDTITLQFGSPSPVPEPGTLPLLASGLAGLGLLCCLKKKAKA